MTPPDAARRLLPVLLCLAVALLGVVVWDERVRLLAWNTLRLSALVCIVSVPAGTWLAVLVARSDMPGRRAVAVLFGSLLFVPLYLQAAGWDAGFGKLGWYSLAGQTLASPVLRGWAAAIWIHSAAAVPWVVLIVGLGLHWTEGELEEQALLDGSEARVFWRLTMRRAAPSILTAALWVGLLTAGEMTVTDLYQVRTYAEELYTSFALGEPSEEVALVGLPGFFVVACLLVAAVLLARQLAPPAHAPAGWRPRRLSLGGARWPHALAVAVFCGLTVGVPLVNMLINAGMVSEVVDGERVRAWSPARLWELLVPLPGHEQAAVWRFRAEFGWTLAIGSLTASTAVLLAAPLAWSARRGGIRSLAALTVVAAGLALPGPLVGIWINRGLAAGIDICSSGERVVAPLEPLLLWIYDRSLVPAVLTCLLKVLAPAVLICWYALHSVPQDVLDAAACDGAGPFGRFFRVALPMRAPVLLGAWLVSFAIAAGDLAAAILVAPPGVITVPIRVFMELHAGVYDQIAAICLTSLAGYLLVAAAGLLVFRPLSRWSISAP